eukprot:TRINITY_DN25144_c0_g1_i1.p1 TRINITY_DN25144_c0_g1~~TRINITY_DN25144_c0_g1_i1.p1  ORF type:complete len:671 (-),score=185.01 TRINITY_DN25144_c0_g1_i1:48-2060(-)
MKRKKERSEEDSDHSFEIEEEEERYQKETKPAKKWRANLQEVLASLEWSFSVGGGADFLPALPGLLIHGIGRVGLPLDGDTALKIAKASRLQQDNVWELESSQFQLINPDWEPSIHKFLNEQVSPGIFQTEKKKKKKTDNINIISIHSYSALLLGAGTHKIHQVEDGNVFATLLLSFPSFCSGGEVTVEFNNEENVYDFGQKEGTSEFKHHYVAFINNMKIKSTTITSGYRFVLQYNLSCNYKICPSEIQKQNCIKELSNLFNQWENSFSQYTIYLLRGQYESSKIKEHGINVLEGRDRQIAFSIHQSNELIDVVMSEIMISEDVDYCSRSGSCDSFWNEENADWSFEVMDCHHTDGKLFALGRCFIIEDSHILNWNAIKKWKQTKSPKKKGELRNHVGLGLMMFKKAEVMEIIPNMRPSEQIYLLIENMKWSDVEPYIKKLIKKQSKKGFIQCCDLILRLSKWEESEGLQEQWRNFTKKLISGYPRINISWELFNKRLDYFIAGLNYLLSSKETEFGEIFHIITRNEELYLLSLKSLCDFYDDMYGSILKELRRIRIQKLKKITGNLPTNFDVVLFPDHHYPNQQIQDFLRGSDLSIEIENEDVSDLQHEFRSYPMKIQQKGNKILLEKKFKMEEHQTQFLHFFELKEWEKGPSSQNPLMLKIHSLVDT